MISVNKVQKKNNSNKSVIVSFCVLLLFCFQSSLYADQHISPTRSQSIQSIRILEALENAHYLKKSMDNKMSSQILDQYLKRLDPRKHLFLNSDITAFKKYEFSLDNDLKRGRLNTPFQIFNHYLNRAKQRSQFILSLIPNWETEFKFDLDDELIIGEETLQWQPDITSLEQLWRKELKNHIITLFLDGQKKEVIVERLEKVYANRLKRLEQTESMDIFQFFMNIVTAAFDPHTQYFPPRASEDFDIHMSLSLEGIGAVLQTEYEYTKVVRLIPKGPADKSALLMPGDKIIGVGQGKEGEIVDTIGQRIDRVVQLIRGPKNTFVRLKIIPAKKNSTTKTVQIKRDRVKLEDQSAKKSVITITQNDIDYKLGIIEIPNFYIDFAAYNRGDNDYKSTSKDVAKLITQLKKEKIDGLIIDLRDNGGGSLQEASQLTGLFIKTGPTVQIRYKHRISRLYDDDPSIAYNGPLIVMMNRMSASASEIFAGAITDYNRGIIIGSRSFGKGTVQELLKLDEGRLKLTRAKFYRVSGESTQHLGVLPDISFPQIYNVEDTGESSLDGALPWDTTVKSLYGAYPGLDSIIDEINKEHKARSSIDPGIIYLEERIQFMNEAADRQYLSLNLEQRKNELNDMEEQELNRENDYRRAVGKPLLTDINDEHNVNQLTDLKEIIMSQTQLIMADFISLAKEQNLTW